MFADNIFIEMAIFYFLKPMRTHPHQPTNTNERWFYANGESGQELRSNILSFSSKFRSPASTCQEKLFWRFSLKFVHVNFNISSILRIEGNAQPEKQSLEFRDGSCQKVRAVLSQWRNDVLRDLGHPEHLVTQPCPLIMPQSQRSRHPEICCLFGVGLKQVA